jgi:hypothetical protein
MRNIGLLNYLLGRRKHIKSICTPRSKTHTSGFRHQARGDEDGQYTAQLCSERFYFDSNDLRSALSLHKVEVVAEKIPRFPSAAPSSLLSQVYRRTDLV